MLLFQCRHHFMWQSPWTIFTIWSLYKRHRSLLGECHRRICQFQLVPFYGCSGTSCRFLVSSSSDNRTESFSCNSLSLPSSSVTLKPYTYAYASNFSHHRVNSSSLSLNVGTTNLSNFSPLDKSLMIFLVTLHLHHWCQTICQDFTVRLVLHSNPSHCTSKYLGSL